jgi:hypothetical protein
MLLEAGRYLGRTLLVLVFLLLLAGSGLHGQGTVAEVRNFTRAYEFDFVQWTLQALAVKVGEYSLNSSGYLVASAREQTVQDFLQEQERENQLKADLVIIYGQPELAQRQALIVEKTAQLAQVERRRQNLQPTAEAILQQQAAVILAQQGFNWGGKNVPPVSFHTTELPFALIVSPRQVIQQEANIQLETDLSLEERVELEERVSRQLDVSALVVPVGGYGTYPTMIQQTTNLPWLTEVILHEWVHNYLTLRPLGLRYETSPELRTMNETAATLIGQAWGRLLLERYYPQAVPPEPPPQPEPEAQAQPEPPQFDFREEMRITRERVDELLAAGEIEQAEAYMEQRRLLFWEQGYRIRKLNQAYFAFHGSYAAEPGGAAGDDPVGEAVRELWQRLGDPAQFLRQMAWMTTPADLERALGRPIDTP